MLWEKLWKVSRIILSLGRISKIGDIRALEEVGVWIRIGLVVVVGGCRKVRSWLKLLWRFRFLFRGSRSRVFIIIFGLLALLLSGGGGTIFINFNSLINIFL